MLNEFEIRPKIREKTKTYILDMHSKRQGVILAGNVFIANILHH